MEHWEVGFTGDWPAPLVLAGAGAAAVLACLSYRRKRENLPGSSFVGLVCLRTLAILLVAAFLLQPVLRVTRAELTRGTVAVLVDTSESMSIRDGPGNMSRLATAVNVLTAPPRKLLKRLADGQKVRLFTFGALTAELPGAARLSEARPEQKATAIGEALKDVVKTTGQGNLAGIVLLSDGVCTYGEDPQRVARGLGVPIFPVALGGRIGERGEFHDVGISRVPQIPDFIVNNTATLKVELAHAGLAALTDSERTLRLRLSDRKGKELASRNVTFPARDGRLEAELQFVPNQVGIHSLRLELDALPDETVTRNNVRSFTVRVTNPQIRVLIVEGTVRTEYRFLRRVLESDPNLRVSSVVKLSGKRYLVQGVQPGVDLSRGLPARQEDYARFDVVILGDIGRDEFTGLQLEYLKAFVDAGGGLLALGGHHAFGPGGYADSALADVLPVTMGGPADGHIRQQFAPELTPDGRAHPIFAGAEEFFEPGPQQVTLDGANAVAGVKPGAQVLLVDADAKAGASPMPVVAVQTYGEGRVMAMTADTTWKWKFQVEARGMDSPYYRFWRQAIRWLAGRTGQKLSPGQQVSAWPAKIEYSPDEPVVLRARVRDRKGNPHERATVLATITYPMPVKRTGPDGEQTTETRATVSLEPVPLSLGEYEATWRAPASGPYKAAVHASDDEGELGTAEFEFVVGRAATEFDRVDADEDGLRALADLSGGIYHTLATAGRIPQEIQQRRRLVAHRRELSLWNAPWFFAALLASLTAEWILRKRRGLN